MQDQHPRALQQRGGPPEAAGREASVSRHVAGGVRPRLAERLRRRLHPRGLRGAGAPVVDAAGGRARTPAVQSTGQVSRRLHLHVRQTAPPLAFSDTFIILYNIMPISLYYVETSVARKERTF